MWVRSMKSGPRSCFFTNNSFLMVIMVGLSQVATWWRSVFSWTWSPHYDWDIGGGVQSSELFVENFVSI